MAIDTRTEKLITMSEARTRLGVSDTTIYTWVKKGVRGRKLEVIRLGNRTMRTSEEALDRWMQYFELEASDGEHAASAH